MPIRTNRGRAAVYRRLWGWPLRSPRHLVVTLVVVAVIAIAIAVVAAQAQAHRNQAAGTGSGGPTTTLQIGSSTGVPGTTQATGSGTPTQTRLASPPETPQSAPPAPAAVSVIESWGQAWVNHPVGMTNQQWLAQLQPYTTPECLRDELSTVDVANVNATELTGTVTPVKSFTNSLEALLPTNAEKLDITAVQTTTGWMVSSYTEAP